MNVVFLTRSLETGGAERQLSLLCVALKQRGYKVTVITLYPGGTFETLLNAKKVEIVCLHKEGRYDTLNFYKKLVQVVRQTTPNILYSFAGTNLLSFPLKILFPRIPLIWSLRSSNMDWLRYGRVLYYAQKCEAFLSPWVDGAIANSRAGAEYAKSQGFRFRHLSVISNGLNTTSFKPDRYNSANLRQEWLGENGVFLIGMIARLDPMKDHETFLRAAHVIYQQSPETRFVIVGGGNDKEYIAQIQALAKQLNLENCLTWAGAKEDVPQSLNALDIFVSSSITEGTPNSLLEAMSCELPCVVTDVGDSAYALNDSRYVVSPKDFVAIAQVCLNLLHLGAEQRQNLGHANRQRIIESFSVEKLTEKTIETLMMFKN